MCSEEQVFRMLLLAMWPGAKLLRCPRSQRNIFEERLTVCVCVCEDVEVHGPRIKSGPEGPPTYRCRVPSKFLIVPEGPRTFLEL